MKKFFGLISSIFLSMTINGSCVEKNETLYSTSFENFKKGILKKQEDGKT